VSNSFVPSTNAYLSSLAVSTTGALTPDFTSNQLSYTASEVYNGAPTITPTSADPNATINIIYDGTTNPITSGTASAPLTLDPDLSVPNVVDVQVTAQDGLTVMDYLVTITQQPSTNAYLSSLAVSTTGALTPAFTSNQLIYTASEAYNGAPTITPTSADPNATIDVIYDGTTNRITSAMASAPLALDPNLSVPNVVDVQVTAQDGLTVMDYLVTIMQQPSLSEPTLTNVMRSGALQLSWPPDHLGYRLLVQTNNLSRGISTDPDDWGTVAGSTTTNMAVVPIIPAQPIEFYRLVYP
jgi:hypothetical protein